jgi:hypothetical protein
MTTRNSLTSVQWRGIEPEYLMWIAGLFTASILWLLMLSGQFDLVCALIVAATLLLVSRYDKATAALLTFTYLFLMGDIRRIVAVAFGQPAQDLLLLVGPAMAFVLAFPLLLKIRLKDNLSKAMLFLLVVMTLETFNPRQGGLSVGLSGAIFYIAPVLWFWVGRHYGSPAVVEKLIYRVIFPLALLAALLGFVQTFIGFLPYEQAWIDIASKSYTALHLGGSIRAFGFSVSGTEYAVLLMFGVVGVAAAYFGSRQKWAVILPILLAGVVLASGRTAVVRIILTLAFIWAFRKGQKLGTSTIVRVVLFAAAGAVLVAAVASRFVPQTGSAGKNSAVNDALAHQAGGLAHPLDPKYSTAGIHGGLIWAGLVEGITYPIGHGLGATTEAAAKFGGNPTEGSSEIDFSDMFISLGLIGGVLYLFVVVSAMRQSLVYLHTVPLTVSLPVAAILFSSLGSWLIGGQYSTSSVTLFLAGALCYADTARSEKADLI